MKNELLKVKASTLHILNKDVLSRSDDIRCIRLVLEDLDLPTDLKELEMDERHKGNILESIRRCRQKLQVDNPMLYAPRTKEKREQMQEEYKEFYG